MSPDAPGTPPTDIPPPASIDGPSTPPRLPHEGAAVGGRARTLALAAGLLAGLLGWASLEGSLHAHREGLKPPMKPFPSEEDNLAMLRARLRSGALGFGAMGAWFGVAFGLAGGAWRRSVGGGIAAALPCGVLGGLATAVAARLTMPFIYVGMDPQSGDLSVPMACHAATWSVAGAVGGLAFGLGAGGRRRALPAAVGGMVGAALATVVYEVLGALIFPTHQTHLPVAGSAEARALGQLLVGAGTAIGAVMAPKPIAPSS